MLQQIKFYKLKGPGKYWAENIFPICLAILGYCIQSNYTRLESEDFVEVVRKNHPKAVIEPRAFFIAISFLFSKELLEKNALFKQFLCELRVFFEQNKDFIENLNQSLKSKSKTKKICSFYTYRLTYQQDFSAQKQYYMG